MPISPCPRRRAPLAALVCTAALLLGACSSDAGSAPAEEVPDVATTLTGDPAVTTPTLPPIDPKTIDGGEEAYVEAMVPLIEGTTGVEDLEAGAVECIAEKWVDAIGVAGFAKAGITPDLLGTPEGSLQMVKPTTGQATEMGQAFGDCDVDLVEVAIDQMTASSKDDDVRDCLEDKLDQEVVEQAFVAGITGNIGGAMAAQAAARKCLKSGD